MDYGAGGGSFSQIMIDSGYYVLATDNSPNMIAELKSKNIPCRLWAYDEPPIDQIFDAIVAKLVIQFIDDLPAFATSMKRQLPSRGKLIVSVPHPDKSRELLQKGSDTYLTEIGSTGLMVHMIHRELNEIRQNFEEQNYRIVAIDSPVDKAGSQPKRLNLCFETLA